MHTPKGLDTASAAITRQTQPCTHWLKLVGPRSRPLDYSFYCRIDHCSFHGPVSGSPYISILLPRSFACQSPPIPFAISFPLLNVLSRRQRSSSPSLLRYVPPAAPVPAVAAWNSPQLAALLPVLRNPNSRSSLTSCNDFELHQFLSVWIICVICFLSCWISLQL
jgi:hypothetical protein